MVAIKKLELAVGVFVALGLVAFFMLALSLIHILFFCHDPTFCMMI